MAKKRSMIDELERLRKEAAHTKEMLRRKAVLADSLKAELTRMSEELTQIKLAEGAMLCLCAKGDCKIGRTEDGAYRLCLDQETIRQTPLRYRCWAELCPDGTVAFSAKQK